MLNVALFVELVDDELAGGADKPPRPTGATVVKLELGNVVAAVELIGFDPN